MAAGWWQGDEAWRNLCAGGTMGVVYGAASLWQWVLRPDEPGHVDYFLAPACSWREALHFPGSIAVGMLGRILQGLPTTDMRPGWQDVLAARCLIVPGKLFVNYATSGEPLQIISDHQLPRYYRTIDPRNGAVLAGGPVPGSHELLPNTGVGPRVTILTNETFVPTGYLDTESEPDGKLSGTKMG
jgi:hypothetical protein